MSLTCHQLSLRSCVVKSYRFTYSMQYPDSRDSTSIAIWMLPTRNGLLINVCMSVCPLICGLCCCSFIREPQKSTKLSDIHDTHYIVRKCSFWLLSPSSFDYPFAEDQQCSLRPNIQNYRNLLTMGCPQGMRILIDQLLHTLPLSSSRPFVVLDTVGLSLLYS